MLACYMPANAHCSVCLHMHARACLCPVINIILFMLPMLLYINSIGSNCSNYLILGAYIKSISLHNNIQKYVCLIFITLTFITMLLFSSHSVIVFVVDYVIERN